MSEEKPVVENEKDQAEPEKKPGIVKRGLAKVKGHLPAVLTGAAVAGLGMLAMTKLGKGGGTPSAPTVIEDIIDEA